MGLPLLLPLGVRETKVLILNSPSIMLRSGGIDVLACSLVTFLECEWTLPMTKREPLALSEDGS
jgi:hypothetical protein